MKGALLIAAAFAAEPARAAGVIQLPPLKEEKLDNGLLTVVAERHELPMVAVRLMVRAGSARDPKGKDGLAALVAGLLRRGTERRSAEQIDEAVESIGGRLAVDAGRDGTVISLSAPSERLDQLLDVAADLAMRPAFAPAEVDKGRERLLGALARALDDPPTLADRALAAAAWGDHPYGHPPEGYTRTVKTFTREDAVALHKAAFVPRGAVLVIVGDVVPGEALARVKELFGGWKAPPAEPPPLPAPGPIVPSVTLIDKPDATQSQVRIGAEAVVARHADYFPLLVASTALGGGFTSRLVDEVRVNRGLTYGIHTRYMPPYAGARIYVDTFTKTETTREIIDVSRKVVQDFQAAGPTPKELEKTQRYLSGLYPLRVETNDDLARELAEVHLYQTGYGFISEHQQRIRAVDRKAAGAAARAYLPGGPAAIVVVGPAKTVQPQLAGLGEVRVLPLSAVE